MKNALKKAKPLLIVLIISACFIAQPAYSADKRIIGGDKAEPGAWQWMALLVDADEPDIYYGLRCGGTLVHSKWIVTAAHCVQDEWTGINISAKDIDVAIGVNDLENDVGERISVKRIVTHPDYNSWTMDSDIALLELENEVSYDTVSLVSDDVSYDGTDATVIGWGATEPDGWEYPSVLQQLSVPVVSNEVCNEAYSQNSEYDWLLKLLGYENNRITDNMLCAGYADGGGDACFGDSGGPLMVQEDGSWKLAGIVSWGEGCAEPGYYGVYTRASAFNDFISKWVFETPPDSSLCGDFNGDSVIDRNDLNGKYQDANEELSNWIHECWIPKKDCGDYNGSGRVNFRDWIEKYSDLSHELYDWMKECWEPESK